MGTLLCSFHSTTQLPPNNTTTSHSHNTSQQPSKRSEHSHNTPNNPQTCRRVNMVDHNTSQYNTSLTIHHPQYIATISPNNHKTCRRTDNHTVQHLPRTPLNVCCRENIPAYNTLCDDIVYTLCIQFPLIHTHHPLNSTSF